MALLDKDGPYTDFRVFVVAGLSNTLSVWWLRWIGSMLMGLLTAITPTISKHMSTALEPRSLKTVFLAAAGLTFLFTFGVTAVLSFFEGTWHGSSLEILYFLQDKVNLLLYVVICPLYVGFSVVLIAISVRHWSELANYADVKSCSNPSPVNATRFYLVFFGALLLCTLSVTNYVYDILHAAATSPTFKKTYWFMTALPDGTRILNRVGYYYICLNFGLLFIVLLGTSCFLSLAREVLRAGSASSTESIDDFETLRLKLAGFDKSYIAMKFLAATLAINYWLWALSPLGATGNLLAAQMLLTLIGAFFISIPRHYIELRWFKLWSKSPSPPKFVETRSDRAKLIASLLDFLFVGLIFSSWQFESFLKDIFLKYGFN